MCSQALKVLAQPLCESWPASQQGFVREQYARIVFLAVGQQETRLDEALHECLCAGCATEGVARGRPAHGATICLRPYGDESSKHVGQGLLRISGQPEEDVLGVARQSPLEATHGLVGCEGQGSGGRIALIVEFGERKLQEGEVLRSGDSGGAQDLVQAVNVARFVFQSGGARGQAYDVFDFCQGRRAEVVEPSAIRRLASGSAGSGCATAGAASGSRRTTPCAGNTLAAFVSGVCYWVK